MLEFALILVQFVSTLLMVGIIWFVQVVHYPLMAHVGREHFCRYEHLHQSLTTWVVGPPMLAEAFSAIALLMHSSELRASPIYLLATVLLALIWLSTAVVQVPLHQSLAARYDDSTLRRLVRSNWLRTMAWTARGLLLGWLWYPLLVASRG
jgi:hypothetical protein